MKISGFTIARNVVHQGYPFREAVCSVLPICDEMVICVGDSCDDTLRVAESICSEKIRIIQSRWDRATQKPDVLSWQTNHALAHCKGDWAFYVQSDEVVHEKDLSRLRTLMAKHLADDDVDGFQFRWMHFYGSYHRYRIDRGWFQKQVRIIRNNSTVVSCQDAWTFERNDGRPFQAGKSGCLLYHYGWVRTPQEMTRKIVTSEEIYAPPSLSDAEKVRPYDFGDLNRFPVYYGSHPKVMAPLLAAHEVSRQDWAEIRRRRWWHPFVYLRPRWKTWSRVKHKIQ